MRLLDPRWCGVIIDSGNFVQSDPYEEIPMLSEVAVGALAKDYLKSGDQFERLNVKRFIKAIHKTGYHGYLSLETIPVPFVEYDPFVALPSFASEIRQAMAMA
jgi:hypothetical protein